MDNWSPFYKEAFDRNIGLLTLAEQDKVRNSTVAIGGLGGAGGVYATIFARLGFGTFHIADLDVFETANMNRQFGASVDTLGQSKVEVMKRTILSINPEAKVEIFPEGINEGNIEAFLKGVNIVLDGIDFFNIEARRLLFREARAQGIYALTAGPIGYGSSMLVFSPTGMSFDRYFDIHDSLPETDKLVRFGIGLTPTLLQRSYFKPDAVNWKTKRAPSLISGILLCANLVSTEALKIVLGKKVKAAPHSIHFDPYLKKLKLVWIPFGNRNPIQRLKRIIMKRVMKARGTL